MFVKRPQKLQIIGSEELLPLSAYCIFKTIGRKNALLILLHLRKNRKLRNKELVRELGGISPSILASLLKRLSKEGLILRQVYGEIPPIATEYSLTKIGKELLDLFDPLLNWLTEKKIISLDSKCDTCYRLANLTL